MSKTKKYLIYIILLISMSYCLTSKDFNLKESGKEYDHLKASVHLSIGYPFRFDNNNFWKAYKKILGAYSNHSNTYPLVEAGAKINLGRDFKLGASIGYAYSNVNDVFSQDKRIVNSSGDTITTGTRSINELIDFSEIPVLFNIEYNPSENQFRSYCGANAGIMLDNIRWQETITSTLSEDQRQGGTHYSKTAISPLLSFYCGIDYGFDKNKYRKYLGSLFIEVEYMLRFTSVKLFNDIVNQLEEDIKDMAKLSYRPVYGSVNLKMGISFTLTSDNRI